MSADQTNLTGNTSMIRRWLVQREVTGDGHTLPAAKVDISHMGQWAARRDHEYSARRTDVAAGHDSIYFRSDRSWFGSSTQSVRLFVTYRDEPEVAWRVEYETASGLATCPPVRATGTEQWRTACLVIPAMRCSGRLQTLDQIRSETQSGNELLHSRLVAVASRCKAQCKA